jgi:MSHA biogenesis protein MshN
MSLINQMLQDLEKRGESENAQPSGRYAQFGSHAPVGTQGKTWKLISLCLVFLLFAFLIYERFSFRSAPAQVVGAAAGKVTDKVKEAAIPANAAVALSNDSTKIDQESQQTELDARGLNLKLSTAVNVAQLTTTDDSSLRSGLDAKTKQEAHHLGGETKVQSSSVQTIVVPAMARGSDQDSQNAKNQQITASLGKSSGDNAKQAPTSAGPTVMVKEVSAQQRAEGEFRQATVYQQQGRLSEAIQVLDSALKSDPLHNPARQLKISLLLESKRHEDAIRELRQGLVNDPTQLNFSMILARLLVERAKLNEAVEVLQKNQTFAQDRPDYLAFLAALQQKMGHHKDAIQLYRQALKKHSQNGVWWMGLGISLQADGVNQEAVDAYKQAKLQPGLSAELQAFVDQKIGQLQK